MKKIYTISIIVILVALVAAVPALAIPGKGAIKGEVIEVDPGEGTLNLKAKRGESVVVVVPLDFDMDSIAVGDIVLVKGPTGEEGAIEAEWIKQIGKGSGKGNDDKAEGRKDNSAFCDGDKQDKLHPLAEKIGERFGVGEDWVMDYFCDGYGMGAIMLALKTSQLEGSDPGDFLKDRAEGKGWGQIWKEKGLIGSEKEGYSPPGHLKRPDHAGPKDKDE
jgi:hypothetical protein